MKKRILSALLAFMLVVTSFAPYVFAESEVSDESNASQNKIFSDVLISDITLNYDAVDVYIGKSVTLSATISPSDATNTNLTFTSNDDNIVKVSDSGVITPVSTGEATITVSTNDGSSISKTCVVTVKKYVSSIKLNKKSYSGKIGKKITLSCCITSDATNKKVSYSTSNKYVATVNSKGEVKLVGPGSATIKCKACDGSGKYATCKITSKPKKAGWLKAAGKKYYVTKKLKVVKGVKTIKKTRYLFNKKTGALEKNKWAYVKLSGRKYKLYFNSKGKQAQNVEKKIGKQKSYVFEVNRKTNVVIAYAKDGKNGYIIPVKAMICSTGVKGAATIGGTFKVHKVGKWHELMNGVYGQYCTQIHGNYLFHSAWYYQKGNKKSICVSEYKKLGRNASHGCVRLTVADAKWIYDRSSNSKAKVFTSKKTAPLKKPKRPKVVVVSGNRGYCSTDPAFKK